MKLYFTALWWTRMLTNAMPVMQLFAAMHNTQTHNNNNNKTPSKYARRCSLQVIVSALAITANMQCTPWTERRRHPRRRRRRRRRPRPLRCTSGVCLFGPGGFCSRSPHTHIHTDKCITNAYATACRDSHFFYQWLHAFPPLLARNMRTRTHTHARTLTHTH